MRLRCVTVGYTTCRIPSASTALLQGGTEPSSLTHCDGPISFVVPLLGLGCLKNFHFDSSLNATQPAAIVATYEADRVHCMSLAHVPTGAAATLAVVIIVFRFHHLVIFPNFIHGTLHHFRVANGVLDALLVMC